MAVGVGIAVGYSMHVVGKVKNIFSGIIAAVFSLVACIIGNLISACAIVANSPEINEEGVSTLVILAHCFANPSLVLEILQETFQLIDLLFYGLAIYLGYTTAVGGFIMALEFLGIKTGLASDSDANTEDQTSVQPDSTHSAVASAISISTTATPSANQNIEINLNGTMQAVSRKKLFDLAAHGIINSQTPINVKGTHSTVGKIKGIVFGEPGQAPYFEPNYDYEHIASLQRLSTKSIWLFILAFPILLVVMGIVNAAVSGGGSLAVLIRSCVFLLVLGGPISFSTSQILKYDVCDQNDVCYKHYFLLIAEPAPSRSQCGHRDQDGANSRRSSLIC